MSLLARLATCPKAQLVLCAGMATLGPTIGGWLHLPTHLTSALGPALAALALQSGTVAASALGEFLGGRADEAFGQFQGNRTENKVYQSLTGAIGLAIADSIREFSHDHPEQKALTELAKNAPARWLQLPSPPLADEPAAQTFAGTGPLTEDSLLARVDWPLVTRWLCRDTSKAGPSIGISIRLAVQPDTADALTAYLSQHFARALKTTLLRSASDDTGAWRQTVLYLLAELVQSRSSQTGSAAGISRADLSAAIEDQFKQLSPLIRAELVPLVAELKSVESSLGERLDALIQEVKESREFQQGRTLFLEDELRRQSQMNLEMVKAFQDVSRSKDEIIADLKSQVQSLQAEIAQVRKNAVAVQALAATVTPDSDFYTRGLQMQATGNYQKAGQYYQRAIGERIVPPIRIYLAQMRMAKHLGNLIEAGNWAEKAAAVCPDEPDWLDEITLLLLNTGRYRAALSPAERVVKLRRQAQGYEHPSTLVSMGNCASTYSIIGQHSKAKGLQENIIELFQRILGDEHPITLRNKSNLSTIYFKLGQYNKAKVNEEQVFDTRQRILESDHPDILVSRSNLASIYSFLGQHATSKDFDEKTLSICRRTLGDEHQITLTCRNNLASTYGRLGQHDEARKLKEETLKICHRILGENHYYTLISMNNLASTYGQLGQHDKARELLEYAYQGLCKILGATHSDAVSAKKDLDSCLATQTAIHLRTKSLKLPIGTGNRNDIFFTKADGTEQATEVSLAKTRIFRRGARSGASDASEES